MLFPEPVISMSIEPKTSEDKRKLSEALMTIRREDPSFRFHFDDETGQTIIAGMGELHLDIIRTKLVRDMKINVEVGKPRVSYREAITRKVEYVRGRLQADGGRGPVRLIAPITIEPFTPAQGRGRRARLRRLDRLREQDRRAAPVPKEFILDREGRSARPPGLRRHRRAIPLINVKVTLVRTAPTTRSISSRVAFEQGRPPGAPGRRSPRPATCLLEPIMKVVVTVPTTYLGQHHRRHLSRRGMIVETEDRGNVKLVTSEIPLSELFGYTTAIRGMSQGRASATMEFLEYRQMPAGLMKEVLAAE
jgi:elongation factor G